MVKNFQPAIGRKGDLHLAARRLMASRILDEVAQDGVETFGIAPDHQAAGEVEGNTNMARSERTGGQFSGDPPYLSHNLGMHLRSKRTLHPREFQKLCREAGEVLHILDGRLLLGAGWQAFDGCARDSDWCSQFVRGRGGEALLRPIGPFNPVECVIGRLHKRQDFAGQTGSGNARIERIRADREGRARGIPQGCQRPAQGPGADQDDQADKDRNAPGEIEKKFADDSMHQVRWPVRRLDHGGMHHEPSDADHREDDHDRREAYPNLPRERCPVDHARSVRSM